MHSDIIKDSTTLKQALLDRWEEIGITHVNVAQDATNRGIKGVTTNAISKWIKNSYEAGALNQYQLLWLMWRYGLQPRLVYGEPLIDKGRLKYVIEQPYNEEKVLAKLYEVFPPKKTRKKKKNG